MQSWRQDFSVDEEDYCCADDAGKLVRIVIMYFDNVTKTWTAVCSCKAAVATGCNCRHMLAVAMSFNASRPHVMCVSMFNFIFRTKTRLQFPSSEPVAQTPQDGTHASRGARRKADAARVVFTTQRNYSQAYHNSRDVCLDVQGDSEETELFLKHIAQFAPKLEKLRRDRALLQHDGEGEWQEASSR